MTTIYHGTPLTPRAALLDVCTGRAMCVSFYRPDDVEAVEAISPAIMFRQRRVFVLETGNAVGSGVGRRSGLDAILRLARSAVIPSGAVGSHPRYAGRTKPAQRCAAKRLALWAEGRTALAYGWADRAPVEAVRTVRPGLLRMDWTRQGDRLPGISSAHGGSEQSARQPLANPAHDARHGGSIRLSVCQCGQHQPRAKWVAL